MERSTSIVVIKNKMIYDRIEASFYKYEDILLENKIKDSVYKVCYLSEICSKITDGTHFTPNYKQKGVKFLSAKNIGNDNMDFKDVKYISQEEHLKISKRCKVKKGDILFSKVGRIGYAQVVHDSAEPFSIFVSVALLKIKNDIVESHYLVEFLNSEYGRKQSLRLSKGSNQPDFHLEDIGKILIVIPPIEVQKSIGNKRKIGEDLLREQEVLISEAKQDVEDLIEGKFDMAKIGKNRD